MLIVAQRHQAEQPLKLYAGWFCPFVQRAWLALEEKGIPYQYVEGKHSYHTSQRTQFNGIQSILTTNLNH